MFHRSSSRVSKVIWILYRKSMEFGKIPSKLKISKVLPVFKKKGRKYDVANYRITAITSLIWIHPNISNAQYGFRSRRSVETNLLNLPIAAHDAFIQLCQLMIIRKMKMFCIGRRTENGLFEFRRQFSQSQSTIQSDET